ncbi:MAG: Ger(x)C family spore germination C-terminal domain-containing protein [Oscillospiraceae bacterium]|nr:Ger(x)C family spore germination C-terminal domain-containing protein [Oscillospiraceae bacterium]
MQFFGGISDDGALETTGLAVFRGDRLVGELNSIETLCHLITTNKLDTATISIPSPFSQTGTIALSITRESRTRNSVEFVNHFPFIRSHSNISANVLSLDPSVDYSNEANIRLIEEYAETFLENNIRSYLYRTAKSFRSDIAGFGRHARRHFWTIR